MSHDFTLFKGSNITPIVGLHAELKSARWRGGCAGCGSQVAVIGEGVACHAAHLRCANCTRHRGWLPRAIVYGLLQHVELHGRPTTIITNLKRFSLDEDDVQSLGEIATSISAPANQTKQRLIQMKVSEQFPSKYLKASDLQGREAKVVIQTVVHESVGKEATLEPVMYFRGPVNGVNKPWILNKTNSTFIGDAYGDDSGDWEGQPLILKVVTIEFQGKATPAIRCRLPTARDNPKPPPSDDGGPPF
jgi:hypothetical protein